MPKAPMYEHYCMMFADHDIGTPGKLLLVLAESESLPVQERPHKTFRLGISAADRAHDFASNWIYHGQGHRNPSGP